MINIRRATADDLDEMIRLDQEIFGEYGTDADPEIIESRLSIYPEGCAVLEDWDETFGRNTFLGYLTTEKWNEVREADLHEDPRESHQPHGHVLNITSLAIAPDYQNRGLGDRLLDQAVEIAQREGCDQIVVQTASAREFYERRGFELVGERTEDDVELYMLRKRP